MIALLALALDPPPGIEIPQEIERKKRRHNRGARAAIGTIIILGDGTEAPQAGRSLGPDRLL